MKKLLFICGPNGIGKSTICSALYKKINHSALVDSDHFRIINPFEFSDELKEVIEDNMFLMLKNYLNCSSIENVIFSYGLHGPRKYIFENIMAKLNQATISFDFIPIVLECELEENIRRAKIDGRDEQRIKYGLDATRQIYGECEYPHIDITHLTVDEAVNGIIEHIQ